MKTTTQQATVRKWVWYVAVPQGVCDHLHRTRRAAVKCAGADGQAPNADYRRILATTGAYLRRLARSW